MRRAAFITPGAYPVPSARGGSVERVVEHFVPLLTPHMDVCIYGRLAGKLPARGSLNGAACERFTAANKLHYRAKVMNRLSVYRPDIIEVENRPRMVPMLRRKFPHAKIWLHLHSNTFIMSTAIGPKALRTCLRAADRILVNSHFLKSDVIRRAPLTASKISVVYPGVDTERFMQADRHLEREKRGWKDREVVLYMGRLIPLKGVHHLLAALPELVKAHPNVLVVIVGSAFYGSSRTSAYVRRLHRMAKPWRRHVHFEPYVSHHEVPAWFALADVAVVPSGKREAFGLVNVEAMASGLPVVATRAGGMKEIIEDGVTGFLVDPGHIVPELSIRISSLLKDDRMRQVMGQLGRERVLNNFTWQHTADRWLRAAAESEE